MICVKPSQKTSHLGYEMLGTRIGYTRSRRSLGLVAFIGTQKAHVCLVEVGSITLTYIATFVMRIATRWRDRKVSGLTRQPEGMRTTCRVGSKHMERPRYLRLAIAAHPPGDKRIRLRSLEWLSTWRSAGI